MEKDLWDVINRLKLESTTTPQTKKKGKNNTIALKIIKQGVNFDLYTNIIREYNPYWSQKIVKQVCF